MLFFFALEILVIAYLEGKVLLIEADGAIIKTNSGVGYHVWLSKPEQDTISTEQSVSLFIHSHVREDAFELFGFFTKEQKKIFSMLISVSGIGPRLAMSMLSFVSGQKIISAILEKDLSSLSKIPGIGKKTAERLCLELKDKIIKLGHIEFSQDDQQSTNIKDSLELAIKGLGYSKQQSDKVITQLNNDELNNLNLEELIKRSLNLLTGNKPL